MKARLLLLALTLATMAQAKNVKTVVLTTQPEMHCQQCEQKIKGNLRFEKGVKSIRTNLKDKTVTIEYDADKTTVDNLIQGFRKIKYEAREMKPRQKQPND